ncbi:MAG TPA: S9 family peptidase, partial [Flavobacteriaceae bacterium]|nr:S9 family peptidase [Flavobacteriaceae bacterium]
SKQQSSTKQITLEDIWKYGTFRTERLGGFHSAKNGDYYYVINNRGAQLDKYSYKTLEKVGTLVDAANLNGINSLFNYTFNKEENKLIIGTETEQIYRHSSRGIFYVYDLSSKKLEKISDNLIQEPTFSPDGNKVAFMYQNNLFYKDLNTNTTKQFTFDGEKNKILNGITDWVYEEEFAFVRAFQWNNNSNKIAFIRFDETKVPEFSMDIYGDDLYPKQQVFKYPKAGENNAEVSLFMYDLTSNSNKKIDLGKDQQHYIPRIEWTKNNKLCVTTLNRHQNNLNLIFVDQNTLQYKIVLNEKDEAYVAVTDNLTFLSDNSFIWTSEKDGYNHIYHYSENGKLINQVTKGNWEVTNYYGFDNKTNKIYFQSTQDGSINRTVSVIDLDGTNLQKLSVNIGSNSAAFSNSFNYYINTFSNSETPTIYTLNESKTGKKIKIIKENSTVLEKLVTYNLGKKEFSTITTKDGNFNMWMMKPANFDASKKYPLFMYQYSGPGSQSVANRWKYSDDYWYHMLNQKGYIVVCVDGRGTGYKGRDFKKVTYKELGKYEIEDQINAAKELGNLEYIDQNRIGIWGWSYGGYMSSLGITKGADTFKMAIAVAPVTSWRFYDSIYTERYMQTPQENASGYDDNSPINFAKLLKGKYLLIHGTGDDNVHVQNTMRMANALVKENKPFEMFIYPDRAHGIYSTRNDRLHLYNKMTKFIEDNL